MRFLCLLIGVILWASTAYADWTFPVTLSAGTASTQLVLGIEMGATDGFDAGKDSPAKPYEEEVVYASFPHPEWGVIVGGESLYGYTRDIRGALPQTYELEAQSLNLSVTVNWSPESLPPRTALILNNSTSGVSIDMTEQRSYTFNPGGTSPVNLTISVAEGDVSAPMSPAGLSLVEKPNAIYLSWDRNLESDMAGYKLHYGKNSGAYERTIDVRTATNYSLMNLDPLQYYYVAVTAYDTDRNESGYSTEVTGAYVTGDVTAPEAPTGLSVNSNKKFIQLSWTANTETDLAGYKLYTGYQPDSWDGVQDVGIDATTKLSGWDKNAIYYFAVSAYDQNDNEGNLSNTIRFPQDTSGPVITNLPGNLVVDVDETQTAALVSWSQPTATDAGDGSVALIFASSPTPNLTSGSMFPLGVTTMTYSATDSDGNVTTESFTVTVRTIGTQAPPVITNVPSDIFVTTKKSNDTDATVRWRNPTATDADGNTLPITVTSSPTSGLDRGSSFPIGTTLVTVTATDSLGQSTTTSFTVEVTAK